MGRFHIGESVLFLGRFTSLYPAPGGVVAGLHADPRRAMFDEYTIVFPNKATVTALDFQLISNVSTFKAFPINTVVDISQNHRHANTRGLQDSRHIVLEGDLIDIHLQIPGVEKSRVITGQILKKHSSDFMSQVEVRICQNNIPLDVDYTNDVGEFRLTRVPPQGPLDLEVLLQRPPMRLVGALSL